MNEVLIAFIGWSLVGCFFIGIGIYSFFSKKPVGFWANAKKIEVNDIKKYNGAMAKLFCIFGIVFIVLGLPLLSGQNNAWIFLSIFGTMLEAIIAMIIYTLVIEKKHKKN